jgi:hypothetical protein
MARPVVTWVDRAQSQRGPAASTAQLPLAEPDPVPPVDSRRVGVDHIAARSGVGRRVARQQPLGHQVVNTDTAGHQHRQRASDPKVGQGAPGSRPAGAGGPGQGPRGRPTIQITATTPCRAAHRSAALSSAR